MTVRSQALACSMLHLSLKLSRSSSWPRWGDACRLGGMVRGGVGLGQPLEALQGQLGTSQRLAQFRELFIRKPGAYLGAVKGQP